MNIEKIEIGKPVVYLPQFLKGKILDENLGVVTSKNESFVFVKYINKEISQATRAEDLYTLENRPDLKEKLGIEIKPINKINKIYLETKALAKKVL